MVSRNVFKLLTTIGIFALTVVAALLPYKLRANRRVLSILNIMAGGVFLGAGLCHLLADSADQFNDYYESQHDHDDHDHHDDHDPSKLTHGGEDEPFPWAFCMAGIGFLTTLIVEQVAHYLMHVPAKPDGSEMGATLINSDVTPSDQHNAAVDIEQLGHAHSHNHEHHSHEHHSHEHNHHEHHSHNHNHHEHNHDEEGHSHAPINTEHQSIVVVVALWLALSFHSVCEGIAMGSANSDDSQRAIVIAIFAHKGLESFSLGTNLIRSRSSTLKYIIFCLLFACMTPMGVLIGHLISKSTEGLVAAYISGFAAGTFLYVATVEVIIPEIKKQQDTLFKCIAVASGFAFMAVIALWV